MMRRNLLLLIQFVAIAGAHFLPALVVGIIVAALTRNTFIGWLAGLAVSVLTLFVVDRLYFKRR